MSKQDLIEEVLYTSLIGKNIEVLSSSNEALVGISGVLVNETRNTFLVDCGGGKVKCLLKEQIVFKVCLKGECLKINGALLKQDLITRIKKVSK